VLVQAPSNNKIDIYSLGSVVMCMVTKRPFIEQYVGENQPQIPLGCPEKLAKVLSACWKTDPMTRPSAIDVYNFLRHGKSLAATTPRIKLNQNQPQLVRENILKVT